MTKVGFVGDLMLTYTNNQSFKIMQFGDKTTEFGNVKLSQKPVLPISVNSSSKNSFCQFFV